MKRYVLGLVIAVAITGCIHPPARTPGLMAAAPPDPALVAKCTSLRHQHNVLATLATGIGALGGIGGLTGDITDTGSKGTWEKIAVGGGGALFAVTGATLGAFAGFASDDYAAAQCSTVAQP